MIDSLVFYGRLLRAKWRWLTWGCLLALGATVLILLTWPPLYRSEATVFVRTPGDVSQVEDGGDSYAQGRAATYGALMNSTEISGRVIGDLGLDMAPDTLSQRIEAEHPAGTVVIRVALSAPSADEAQRTLGVLLSEQSANVRVLESVPGSLVPRAEFVIVDPPDAATRVTAWGAPLPLVLLGAVLLGLVASSLAAVIATMRESNLGSCAGRPGAATPTEERDLRWV